MNQGGISTKEASLSALCSAGAVLALCFLCLVWGGVSLLGGWFPSRELRGAYQVLKAVKQRILPQEELYSSALWQPDRRGISGAALHAPDRALAGYTLYTGGHAQKAFLIALDGQVVHEWHVPYRRLWDPSCPVKKPQPPHRICWRKAHVFPNGDLLALVVAVECEPGGYGLVKVDRASRVLWKFLERAHGDFDVGPDGRIFTLTQRVRWEPVPGARKDPIFGVSGVEPPLLEDFVTVLSPAGETLTQFSIIEALMVTHLRKLVDFAPPSTQGLFLAADSLNYVDAREAAAFAYADTGQVLVSLPATRAIVTFDLDAHKAVWAMRGPWVYQLDPDILPGGNLLVFDSMAHLRAGGSSRVLEVDPATSRIAWSFQGDAAHPFGSLANASQQRLANGNTLIAESGGGRMLEVTADGAIVWEFVIPVRGGPDRTLVPVLGSAERIGTEYFDPDFRKQLAEQVSGGPDRRTAQPDAGGKASS